MDLKARIAKYFKARLPFDDAAYELADGSDYFWRVSDETLFFNYGTPPKNLAGWAYMEDLEFLVRKSDYTIANLKLSTGDNESLILDNTKEITR